MRWRRLDLPGRETARIDRTADGWRLSGELEAEEAGVAARLGYVIDCDTDWRTRRAVITGLASGAAIRFEFGADGAGHWTLNGAPLPLVEGALDLDLGFTPATNLLPIRRLDLAVGERAEVRTAWLRFPELRVEALQQSYRREAPRVFRYVSLVDGEPFEARLDTDSLGRVLHYQGLWEAEPMRLDLYVNYRGNCEPAFQFYQQHLGGRITGMARHGEQPNPGIPADWKGKVLHARIEIGGAVLMGADIPSAEPMRSAYLTLTVDSEQDAERIYGVLSEGGEIFMKMEKTPFANRFAMLRDRFGASWMLLHQPEAG
jgi:PhnB protein